MKKLNFSTMTKFTGDEVGKLMNRVTNHYIFFSGTGLPLIKLYQITHETIEEALETVKDISDLYNEDKLKELLTNRGNK